MEHYQCDLKSLCYLKACINWKLIFCGDVLPHEKQKKKLIHPKVHEPIVTVTKLWSGNFGPYADQNDRVVLFEYICNIYLGQGNLTS